MASGGAPSGLRQRQVMPELPAGADAELGEHLAQGYSAGGPQILARFGSPLLAAQPFAVHQSGAGEMDGDVAAPETAVEGVMPKDRWGWAFSCWPSGGMIDLLGGVGLRGAVVGVCKGANHDCYRVGG
jgi:hypothetical protein